MPSWKSIYYQAKEEFNCKDKGASIYSLVGKEFDLQAQRLEFGPQKTFVKTGQGSEDL